MQLVFEVCDTGRGEPSVCKTFDGRGGVIGRGAACDWSIVDPHRLMSSHHGVVSYRDGQYFLTDISSNGIGLSGSAERLHKGLARLIGEGDVYMLGSVSIRARFQGEHRQACSLGDLIPDDAFLGLDPVHALDRERRRSDSSEELEALSGTPQAPALSMDHGPIEREHLVVPQWAEPVREATPAPPSGDKSTAQEAFWLRFGEALGMPVKSLDTPACEVLAIKAAGLLRQAIDGLYQGLRTRDDLKGELNVGEPIPAFERYNPLEGCTDSQSALAALLAIGEPGRLPAELAVVHACRDLQVHQLALVVACRATLRSMLAAFAPDHLLLCFERDDKPPRFSTGAAHWRAYQRYYRRQIDNDAMTDELLRHDFARAYQEQVRLVSTLHAAYPG
ncbi:type VI secretion system-associated FHA domain protein TagH [Pseudomonas poae]|uniref:Type VI secretion system-associated FHA domain protein TagH n=1 Tax=Pseudomonas poae TaxID=200451 RepID=A0A2S9E896_9PSED|nr:type VI secretion system-associated FHA domain protein TagH [Pseudomonas poae]PRA23034.1 type VI secretion system-associated FHA domain protein TagH [Pseudomonas poae]PRC11060.1 type VI secretion system-associated FHA domain protein TagH [Pseudomonas poae]